MCDRRGARLNNDQLLWRHLLEGWIDNATGEPTSQGFRPLRPEDEDCLSVDQSDNNGTANPAVDAFRLCSAHPPEGFGNAVKSTWAVSIAEVTGVGLEVWADPEPAANEAWGVELRRHVREIRARKAAS